MENKHSFFSIKLDHNGSRDQLEEKTDLVLHALNVGKDIYKFKNGKGVIYYFKTNARKRKGQVLKACKEFLPAAQEYDVLSKTKDSYHSDLIRLRNNKNYTLYEEPWLDDSYSGKDIEKFKDRKNWHHWQIELWNLIYCPDGSFRIPDDRQIVSLVDKIGQNGKSQFFKWLFVNDMKNVGRLSYGTTSQLKSSICRIGKKQLYIIDLSRSKPNDAKEVDLLATIEDL